MFFAVVLYCVPMALFSKKEKDDQSSRDLTDRSSYPSGPIAGRFFTGVDRAVKVQAPVIESYVKKLQDKNPGKSVFEHQEALDKRFRTIATGSGVGTGGLAAVPGIGTMMSLAGIAGESVALLEVCSLYALASAKLHGLDISDEEHRKTIVLIAVSGATGKDLISALTEENALAGVKSLRGLTKVKGKDMVQVNSILGRFAFKQVRRRFGRSMFGKLLPFGVGAVLGGKANRTIADGMIKQVHAFVDEFNRTGSTESTGYTN